MTDQWIIISRDLCDPDAEAVLLERCRTLGQVGMHHKIIKASDTIETGEIDHLIITSDGSGVIKPMNILINVGDVEKLKKILEESKVIDADDYLNTNRN